GFNWNDVYVASAADGNGYANGIVSPGHDAYNGFNGLASFSPVSGTFTLNSFYLTAAFGPELVDFKGYLGGVQQHAVSLLATNSGPTFYTLNWSNIDKVTFVGESAHSVLDNISVNGGGAVPEPASWALMIGGFGLAGAALRRRRQVALAA
ncbi:MAG: PEPxxWA-CTERM sorting domain-containing protein, partial [Phenylobacterium sp.]